MAVHLLQKASSLFRSDPIPPAARARRQLGGSRSDAALADQELVTDKAAQFAFEATIAARQSAQTKESQSQRQMSPVKSESADAEVKKAEEAFFAEVYIWDADGAEGRCGHSGMALKRDTGETEVEEEYFAIWPNKSNTILNNPLVSLFGAVPAQVHSQREQCEEREGIEGAQKASRTFSISLTEDQYYQMQDEIARIKKAVDKGTIGYALNTQMNPGVAITKYVPVGYLSKMLSSDDHIEDLPGLERAGRKREKFNVEHCTTALVGVFAKAGIVFEKSVLLPFEIAPNQLGNQLDQQASDTTNSSFISLRK